MKKRIFNIVLIIMSLFILVSCLETPIKTDYVSPSNYETKIIKTSKELGANIVTLMVGNKPVASAVVVDVSDSFGKTLVTAVTSGTVLKDKGRTLTVGARGFASYDTITDYTYNIVYDIGVIQFNTKTNLRAAKIITSGNQVYDHKIGQSIITLGAIDNATNYNSVKVGMITNTNLPYNNIADISFMHDATVNQGDIGSGVFDINGNLLGINVYKYSKSLNMYNNENITGTTLAIPTHIFANVIKNVSNSLMKEPLIPNSLLDVSVDTIEYNSIYPLETAYITENAKLSEKTITVKNGDELASGLVYNKTGDDYWVITKAFNDFSDLEIYSHNYEQLTILKSYKLDDFYLSIHKVKTPNELPVYTSKAINNLSGIEMIEGMSLLSLGTPLSEKYAKTLTRATLSKNDYLIDENVFIHDGNLNFGQKGAPIFNINGELLGFNVEKVDTIDTSNDAGGSNKLLAEGLSFAVSINSVANAINYVMTNDTDILNDDAKLPLSNLSLYEASIKDEQLVIDVVKKVRNKTVTVKTAAGHGSGVIFKKESIAGGLYRYYVITNNHVIRNYQAQNSNGDITIAFNYDQPDAYAVDFISAQTYDIAVVRFVTQHNLEYISSNAINNGDGNELLIGQKLISLGTPESIYNNGYVSTGNFTGPIETYNTINNLGLVHNTPINPGNSGGPIFNLNGELVGINVSKIVNAFNLPALGIGTSLNINVLSPVINNFQEVSYISVGKGRLGITVMDLDVFDQDEEGVTLPATSNGVVVVEVNDDYDSFGKVDKYDVITHMNGIPVANIKALGELLIDSLRGQTIDLRLQRIVNNATVVLEVTIRLG